MSRRILAFAILLLSSPAPAQTSQKPMQIIVPFAPGASADGIAATGAPVIKPHLPGGAGFDPLRELTPVAKLIEIPIVVVANPQTGPKTILELIARAKASPAGLSYGSTGVNSGQHLTMEFL